MTTTIAGCQIQEKIYESDNSLIFRTRQEEAQPSVILKMLKQAYPPPEKIAWFKREYELTRSFHYEGIIKAYDLTIDQHRPVIVLEDFGGESLAVHLKKKQRRFSLAEFLPLTIEVAGILDHLHRQRVIHKDVNLSNIVWNPKTAQVKLIDFGISTVLASEEPVLRSPTMGEGTLAYISPEQTGRMNRDVDYRTDLYSLGVSFYELLTGQLPFPTVDALELMHAHLAKQPVKPHDVIPDIPHLLSVIVMKLMAKNAEDRYQSAYGLKADLEECLRQWQATRQIDSFPLSQQDVVDRFLLPQKLYGRDGEVSTLLTAFERVSQGTGELMLVSGDAGVGKSALIREVHKPITRLRGYFISGKFDQFHKDIPYAPIIQAFRSLIRQLLTESEAQIALRREQLLAALGSNGQAIIDVVPEVALILGPQPPVPALPPTETQNRFNVVLQNFIRVFAQANHPLVLFLDDLQWADVASLNLVRLFMTDPDKQCLFIIGAYRDNEVNVTHPLMFTLDEIQKAGRVMNHTVLQPLGLSDLSHLVADTLKSTPEKVRLLAELILAKTNGNPFFVHEFLKSLHAEGLLTFDFQRERWQWDLARIQAQDITDNVVELMSNKLQKLPQPTRRALTLAACIGNQFDLRTLATAYEQSAKRTAVDLWKALEQGVILPLGNTYQLVDLDVQGLTEELIVEYKFSHDRIQQAAYSLVPEPEKQVVHWQIGHLLLQNTPSSDLEQRIFAIVNQLNSGRECAQQQEERDRLVALNLTAGKRAKLAGAYSPALNYLQVGLHLLSEDAWERQYEFALALYVEAAEAAYLSGDFDRMEQLTDIVFQQAATLLDTVKAYEVRLSAYSVQKRQRDGITLGLQVLGLLDIHLPATPTQTDISEGLADLQFVMAGKTPEDLLELQRMTDPYKLAATNILLRLFHPTFTGAPELFPLVVFRIIKLSAIHGNTPSSALAYAAYGFILCGILGDVDTGYRFGQLALNLVERFNAREVKAGTLFIVNAFVKHWKEHIKETLQPLLEAYQTSLETGDLSIGPIAALDYDFQLYWMGKELGALDQELGKYSEAFRRLKQDHILIVNEIYRQVVLNLRGQSENLCQLIGEHYNEEIMIPRFLAENDANALAQTYLHKLILCYLFQNYPQCLTHAALAEKYLNGVAGTPAVPAFYLYDSLARIALASQAQNSTQEDSLQKVSANQEKMKLWAHHAPMNYLHKFYLVEAERARVLGNEHEARDYYDQAIDLAQEHEYVNEEALANELAAKFYLEKGQVRLGQHYLRDAHYAYTRWGALAKVKDLETRYPQLLARSDSSFSQSGGSMVTASTEQRLSNAFDFTSILHASQAISSEIRLDKLLTKLMALMIENAGAQRGVLILEKDGHLVIEAEKAIDHNEVQTLQSVPVETQKNLPLSILRYVERMKEQVVFTDATQETGFATDPYISAAQPKSLLCTPLVTQGKLTGLLYLENNLTIGAFTPERLEVLHLLGAEAAIAIENARLYGSLEEKNTQLADYSKTLEQRVEERTQALQEKNRELETANLQVQEANRRKSQFLAGMSHELRTPMNAILGFTRLVLRRAGNLLPERQRENLVKVRESADQLLGLINQVLDLSRLEAGRTEVHVAPFDVKRLILTCCELVMPLVKSGVQLKQEISDEVGQVNTDEDGLRHIVLNLISNAIKFTDVGEVVIRAKEERSASGEKTLVIVVSDTGVGMPTEALDTIFEEFQQVEGGLRKREGTGLGLPIAKRWVDLLGGSIAVESELDKGSTFTVTLPVVYRHQRDRSRESASL